MMEVLDERQPLNEMATVCKKSDGYGMIIEVYSHDHGTIGNKANPAHAHVKSLDDVYLGKFAITDKPPSNGYYVFDCDKNKEIPLLYKSKIAKWAKAKNISRESTNWVILKGVWRALH